MYVLNGGECDPYINTYYHGTFLRVVCICRNNFIIGYHYKNGKYRWYRQCQSTVDKTIFIIDDDILKWIFYPRRDIVRSIAKANTQVTETYS